MRRFIFRVFVFILLPVIVLAVLYLLSDPYKTLKPFSLEYFDTTNRDYLSSELFMLNNPEQNYDSFIFSSSRGCGLNTYHWAKYLPEGSRQFLFQAWGETLTGMEDKISFIDKNGNSINNVLILFDIPSSFSATQRPRETLSIKDPAISGESRLRHQMILFYNFLLKPSQWIRAFKQWIHPVQAELTFDPISNDWDRNNFNVDLSVPPPKDSLKGSSSRTKEVFLQEIKSKTDNDLQICTPLIDQDRQNQLKHIVSIFERHGTNVKIVISPAYCYLNMAISPEDLLILHNLFGAENVFDFSGKNPLTTDYNNFSDPNHFGQFVGWHIIEQVYGPEEYLNQEYR